MIINNNFEDPYNKFPPADFIPSLSRPLVNSKLTNKFWKITKNIFEATLKEDSIELRNKNSKKSIYNNIINNQNYYGVNNINFKQNNYQEKYVNNKYKEDNNINEEEEKKKYIEICKSLKSKNDKYDEIISKQEEENKYLVKKVEELENIINIK